MDRNTKIIVFMFATGIICAAAMVCSSCAGQEPTQGVADWLINKRLDAMEKQDSSILLELKRLRGWIDNAPTLDVNPLRDAIENMQRSAELSASERRALFNGLTENIRQIGAEAAAARKSDREERAAEREERLVERQQDRQARAAELLGRERLGERIKNFSKAIFASLLFLAAGGVVAVLMFLWVFAKLQKAIV